MGSDSDIFSQENCQVINFLTLGDQIQTFQPGKLSSYKFSHFGADQNQPFPGSLMRATMQRDLGGNHTLLGRGAEKAGLSRYHTKQAQSESYTVTDRASASTVAPPRT